MTWEQPLQRADGPECPRCGCCDARIVRRPVSGAHSWLASGKARCRACGARFNFREMPPDTTAPPVEHREPIIDGVRPASDPEPRPRYQVFVCGACGERLKATHSRHGVRHYKCSNEACGKRYKLASEEIVALREN